MRPIAGVVVLLLAGMGVVGVGFLVPSAMAQPTFVGSAACAICHKDIHGTWQDTLHNKSQQELTLANDAIVVKWAGTVKLKFGNTPEVSIELHEGPDGVNYTSLIDAKEPSQKVTYPMVRTYGGWGWKQRYQVKLGDSHFILPIQWNQASSRWVSHNPQYWYNEDGSLKVPPKDRSFEAQCSGCHMVATAASAEAGDIHAHDFKIIHPQVSLDMFNKDPGSVIPNSCSNVCHKAWSQDKDGREKAVAAFRTLFEK